MKLVANLLLLVVLTGCAMSRGNPAVCGDRGELLSHTKQASTSLALDARSDEPMLYWVSDHYAVLMPPAAVTNLLRSRISADTAHPSAPDLLAYIEADTPLKHDTDLRKYSIRNTRVDPMLQYIAAELLESRVASVVDLWQPDEEKDIRSIVMVRLEGNGIWRDFCETSGHSILFVTDMIAN